MSTQRQPPMRTVMGQRIHGDQPWTCALCSRRYHRRHVIEVWEHRYDPVTHELRASARHKVRLCADSDHDCAQMGLARLFTELKRARRNG